MTKAQPSPSGGPDGNYAVVCNGPCGLRNGACFVGGTLIRTEIESTTIENIEIDNLVWAYDFTEQKTVLSKVITTSSRQINTLVIVVINGDTLRTTTEHPFHTQEKGWLAANKLEKGIHLQKLDNIFLPVDTVYTIDSTSIVYNFEVENQHNYFVGDDGVLVHNSCNFISTSDFPSWKRTHPEGTQNEAYISELEVMLQNGDYQFYSDPIITVTHDGTTYLIDGHHRLQAAININYDGNLQHLNISIDEIPNYSPYADIQDLINNSF